jgi:hypothetical protein
MTITIDYLSAELNNGTEGFVYGLWKESNRVRGGFLYPGPMKDVVDKAVKKCRVREADIRIRDSWGKVYGGHVQAERS